MRTLLKKCARIPWQVSKGYYGGTYFSVRTQSPAPSGVVFKTDGTKIYVSDSGNDTVFQYSLSSAWDISTASYDSVSFSVATEDTTPNSLIFKTDGAKMYIMGRTNNSVFQYSLSSAWDISTASYDSVSFSVATEDTATTGLSFKTDGTKMYILGVGNRSVFQYSLSSAWDISTASYDSVSFSISGQDSNPFGVVFKTDGTKMYIIGNTTDSVFQYSLSSAWDISTASYDSVSFSVSGQENDVSDVAFKSDGTSLYVTGTTNDSVYQYSL